MVSVRNKKWLQIGGVFKGLFTVDTHKHVKDIRLITNPPIVMRIKHMTFRYLSKCKKIHSRYHNAFLASG